MIRINLRHSNPTMARENNRGNLERLVSLGSTAGRATANATRTVASGAVRYGVPAARVVGRGVVSGARGVATAARSRGDYMRIQRERDARIADPDDNEADLPVYLADGNAIQRPIGRFLHTYHESRGLTERAIEAAVGYGLLGVAGNLGALWTGEPAVNTVTDMVAPLLAYIHVAREPGNERDRLKQLGLYALAALAGREMGIELIEHSGVSDGFQGAKLALEQGANYLGTTPGWIGASAGLVAKGNRKIRAAAGWTYRHTLGRNNTNQPGRER